MLVLSSEPLKVTQAQFLLPLFSILVLVSHVYYFVWIVQIFYCRSSEFLWHGWSFGAGGRQFPQGGKRGIKWVPVQLQNHFQDHGSKYKTLSHTDVIRDFGIKDLFLGPFIMLLMSTRKNYHKLGNFPPSRCFWFSLKWMRLSLQCFCTNVSFYLYFSNLNVYIILLIIIHYINIFMNAFTLLNKTF